MDGENMFHIGPAGYPKGSRSPRQAMERLRALGLDALELQFVRQARMGESRVAEIKRASEELKIRLSAHAPYYINFDSKNKDTVVKSGEWLMRTVRIAHLVGAHVVVLHAAVYGNDPKMTTSRVKDGLDRCRERMDEEGSSDVVLGIETMGRRSAWGTLEEIAEITRQVPGTMPVLDFAHLHARDGGALRTEDDFVRAIEAWEDVHKGDLHCHFSCVDYGDKGERRHLTLDVGEPDVDLFARAILRSERDVTVITEGPEIEMDALRAKRAIESEQNRRDYVYH